MFSEKEEWSVTARENGALEIKKVTTVMKDGEPIANTIWRTTVEPGGDVSGFPDLVQNVAKGIRDAAATA